MKSYIYFNYRFKMPPMAQKPTFFFDIINDLFSNKISKKRFEGFRKLFVGFRVA